MTWSSITSRTSSALTQRPPLPSMLLFHWPPCWPAACQGGSVIELYGWPCPLPEYCPFLGTCLVLSLSSVRLCSRSPSQKRLSLITLSYTPDPPILPHISVIFIMLTICACLPLTECKLHKWWKYFSFSFTDVSQVPRIVAWQKGQCLINIEMHEGIAPECLPEPVKGKETSISIPNSSINQNEMGKRQSQPLGHPFWNSQWPDQSTKWINI